MTFGDRLRKLRKQADMTQEQVAKNLNIVRSTYAYYETGKTSPDFNTVVRLARLFHVTTDYLLSDEESVFILKDPTASPYTPSPEKSAAPPYPLREAEMKLLTAFRYLDSTAQEDILGLVEQRAANLYEQRTKKEKRPPGPPGELPES